MPLGITKRISVPYGRKVSALRAEKSKANFSFREVSFSSEVRQSRSRKGKFASRNGKFPEIFPLEDYSLFSHRDAFFLSVAP